MLSRRNQLLKTSPHRGTGRYIQYLRCPCCGKLARGQAIGSAGQHELSVSQCVGRRPGYRTGFDWRHDAPSREHLEALKESLERALGQVNDALGEDAVPAEVLREFHLQSVDVLSEWYEPGSELRLEVDYGYSGEVQVQEEEGEVVRPRRLRVDDVRRA